MNGPCDRDTYYSLCPDAGLLTLGLEFGRERQGNVHSSQQERVVKRARAAKVPKAFATGYWQHWNDKLPLSKQVSSLSVVSSTQQYVKEF